MPQVEATVVAEEGAERNVGDDQVDGELPLGGGLLDYGDARHEGGREVDRVPPDSQASARGAD
jgi:hypothetical protein